MASNPSQVKLFSIDSIMEHNQISPVKPIKSSTSELAVMYENNFVVLDDAKHVIGVNGRDKKK